MKAASTVTAILLSVWQSSNYVSGFTLPSHSSKLTWRSEFLESRTEFRSSVLRSKMDLEEDRCGDFDPLGYSDSNGSDGSVTNVSPILALAVAVMTTVPQEVSAAATAGGKKLFNSGDFNPDNFRPVCPTSDGIYRFLQGTTQSLVGDDNFVEYGPLIAGGLLRIRLELCVVESFFNEAVGPFIEKEGLGWILPLHESVETFLAGTIFALASTFILVGSTKIVSVLVTYGDVFIGAPCRLFGGFTLDRALGRPVTLDIGVGPFKKRVIGPGDAKKSSKDDNDNTLEKYLEDIQKVEPKDIPVVAISGFLKVYGEGSKITREFLEALDLFVGRYLTLIATGYIGFKFLHFKVFPDFPPF